MINQRPFKWTSTPGKTSTKHCSSDLELSPVHNNTSCQGHSYSYPHICSQSHTWSSTRNVSSRKLSSTSLMKRVVSCIQGLSVIVFAVVFCAVASVLVTAHLSYKPTYTPSPLLTGVSVSYGDRAMSTEGSAQQPELELTDHYAQSVQNIGPSATRNRLDWDGDKPEAFCSEIKAFPQPLRKNCSTAEPVPGAPKCDPEHPMMFSQYGEDYFLYTRHFRFLQRPGTYLDIATNNPISISNTYFMDRCLGWSGVCVEANSRYFEAIHKERSCALVPTCASAIDGQKVEFALSGPGSGIVSTHRQGEKIKLSATAIEKKTCVSVKSQLFRYGVQHVDYFNLDVEGGEMSVLKGVDWERTTFGIISVEIAPSTEQEIHEYLTERGFIRINHENPGNGVEGMVIYPSNRFYINSSITFGSP